MDATIVTDGSGPGSGVYDRAGYGTVVYAPLTSTRLNPDRFYGPVLSRVITGASIVNGMMEITYGNATQAATNNRGELCGLLCGILVAKQRGYRNITVVMDSKYCIGIFEAGGWLVNWKNKGIVQSKLNPDLVTLIDHHMTGLNVTFVHQKAHLTNAQVSRLTGINREYAEMNRIADELAESGKLLNPEASR